MNLQQNDHFMQVPRADVRRSKFSRNNQHLTTFSAAKLIPIYFQEVLPGDTVKMSMNCIIRGATPLHPVMDNAYADVHWFFVPARLTWEHWKNFMGESEDAWTSNIDYSIPVSTEGVSIGSIGDYLGIPVGVDLELNALPFRAYQLIWNEWYRDEALQDPELVLTGDNAGSSSIYSRRPFPVNKYKDYFTSALPAPQKGEPVNIALGNYAPVLTRSDLTDASSSSPGLRLLTDSIIQPQYLAVGNGTGSTYNDVFMTSEGGSITSGDIGGKVIPVNLWTDLQNASTIDVNTLRTAFAIQRMLETDARSGTRYRELVKAHFGVDVGDARVQVPEYLGGKHIPINISQVVQQSSVDTQPTPLGTTGAFSKTFDADFYFEKSFVEHGFLFGFVSVRTDHTYQQGLERYWSKRDRYDFYWPELANIGEQPVYKKELYALNAYDEDDSVFGYQEAWADYRYALNRVTGNMRSSATDSYDVWHYADDYESRPYLNSAWIQETTANIDRTLVVPDSDVDDQYIAQFYFMSDWTRPMPIFSIPGVGGRM